MHGTSDFVLWLITHPDAAIGGALLVLASAVGLVTWIIRRPR